MTASVLVALLAAGSPHSFSETQARDIGCLATVSIIAEEQQRGALGSSDYPDVREAGRMWADHLIPRISQESGQPEQTVKAALWAAVSIEQGRVENVADPKAVVDGRMRDCLPVMLVQLEIGGLEELSRQNGDGSGGSGSSGSSDIADYTDGAGPCSRIDINRRDGHAKTCNLGRH